MKKGKAVVVLIIILFLAAGGYLVYDNMFSGQHEAVANVEVKKISSINLNEEEAFGIYFTTDENNYKIFTALDKSEATCFEVKKQGKTVLEINQINKNDFDEISPVSFAKARKLLSNGTSTFLNMHYDKLPIGIYDPSYGDYCTIFGKLFFDGGKETALEWVEKSFGEEIEEMFEKYKLVLSCDNVSVKKIAVCDSGEKYYGSITGIGDVVGDHFRYYCIIDTEVKTESADGKISKLGVFADEGEIKKIKFLMICDLDTTLNELSISRIYFD